VCENNTIWRADFKMAGVCYFHVYGLQKDYTPDSIHPCYALAVHVASKQKLYLS